jgi:hypothetical protein
MRLPDWFGLESRFFALCCAVLFPIVASVALGVTYIGGARDPASAVGVTYIGGVKVPDATDFTTHADIIAGWLMNSEGDATEIDRSVNGLNLVESTGDTIDRSNDVPTGWAVGSWSKTFASADSEALRHADNVAFEFAGGEFTLSIWIKPASFANNGKLFNKWKPAQKSWELYHAGTTDKLILALSTNCSAANGIFVTTVNLDLDIDTWSHVAVTYDADILIFYENGVLADSFDVTNGLIPCGGTSMFSIGNRQDLSQPANAEFDEAALFSSALSADEILELATTGIDGTKGGNDG